MSTLNNDSVQDSGSENVEQEQGQETTSVDDSSANDVETATEPNENSTNSSFDNRSRESLIDEIQTLRSENAKKRKSLQTVEQSVEQRIAHLESVINAQNTEIRVGKLKAAGVSDDQLHLFDHVEDEEAAMTLARLISGKGVAGAGNADLNQSRGVKPATTGDPAREDLLSRLPGRNR